MRNRDSSARRFRTSTTNQAITETTNNAAAIAPTGKYKARAITAQKPPAAPTNTVSMGDPTTQQNGRPPFDDDEEELTKSATSGVHAARFQLWVLDNRQAGHGDDFVSGITLLDGGVLDLWSPPPGGGGLSVGCAEGNWRVRHSYDGSRSDGEKQTVNMYSDVVALLSASSLPRRDEEEY